MTPNGAQSSMKIPNSQRGSQLEFDHLAFGIERLEARQMLAAGFRIAGDNLKITGSRGDDVIHVSTQSEWVTVNGTQTNLEADRLNRLIVNSKSGDDMVIVDSIPFGGQLKINTATGDDTVRIGETTFTGKTTIRLSKGNDTLDIASDLANFGGPFKIDASAGYDVIYVDGVRTSAPQVHASIEGFESRPADFRELEFYGMEYVDNPNEYSQVAGLGINTVMLDFAADGNPASWLGQLDQAQASGFQVVAVFYPDGWSWDEASSDWVFTDQAVEFLETVEGHSALFAVYSLHEPYWRDCYGCGYTTAQQQSLYSDIKAIADVPIYASFSSFQWAHETYGEDYAFADGIADYGDTWFYPSERRGYDEVTYRETLESELAYVRSQAPNTKFVWVMQAFGSKEWGKRMPTYDQMVDLASAAMEYDIDGVFWYTWDFDQREYQQVLSEHPDLQWAVRQIYDEFLNFERIAAL